ncbi:MAG TPA: SpoIID/LytB domain-containing protein [Acidimicrobiales bacterium]|nr:SpoIID/LytB domain-containing protein [Acidimicrobiales bacterium]
MKRRTGILAVLSLTAGLIVAVGVASPPPAAAYPNPVVELFGHGFGHGRGLGQYGALGYAIDHGWSYKQIVGHYYGGTTEGNIGNPTIAVRLSRMDGKATLVQQERGQMSIAGEVGTYTALQVLPLGNSLWQVQSAPTCAGPWSNVGGARAGSVSIVPTVTSDDPRDMIQICEAGAYRWYRGAIESHYNGTSAETINRLEMESYLRGVVPRESPASWADLGGGAGIHALRAQAVAARSYAQAEDRPGVSKTCDTTSCQVYLGKAEQVGTAAFKLLEDARTDRAIVETAGEVRMLNGAIARTEFSSSTGGVTAGVAGGSPFPTVTDDGDDTASNPNHNWTSKIGVDVVEAKYGKGGLVDIKVLERNGLGAEGGRVRKMRLFFTGGNVDVTGDEFRLAFNLKSDWFTPVNIASFPYHVVTRDGGVFSFGGAEFHGSLPGIGVKTQVKDITEGPGGGYWLLGEDGGVFSFDVPFYGSMGGQRLNKPVVGMEASASRQGYWLVAGDGGIFSFGDAPFFGSTGNVKLNQPVVAMAPTKGGRGYWMVATDGGIFTFGDAPFHGSTGDLRLNQPVFAMAPTPGGQGYWLVARDGGIFTFGDATFQGSLPGRGVLETAVELLPSPSGFGYLIVTAQGRVHAFGDASSGGGPADVGGGGSPAVGAGRVV